MAAAAFAPPVYEAPRNPAIDASGSANGGFGGNQDPSSTNPSPTSPTQQAMDEQRIATVVATVCQQQQKELFARLSEQERTISTMKAALYSLSADVEEISDFLAEASARYNSERGGSSGGGGGGSKRHHRDYYDEDNSDEDDVDDNGGGDDSDDEEEEAAVVGIKRPSKSSKKRVSDTPKSGGDDEGLRRRRSHGKSSRNGSRPSKGEVQNHVPPTAMPPPSRDGFGNKRRKIVPKKDAPTQAKDKKPRQGNDRISAGTAPAGKRSNGEHRMSAAPTSRKAKDGDRRRYPSRDTNKRHTSRGSERRRRRSSSSSEPFSSERSSYESSQSSEEYSSESAFSSEDDRPQKKRGGRDKRGKGTQPVRFEEGPLD